MKRSLVMATFMAAVFVLLTGCRTSPIFNVKNQGIITNQSNHTEVDVKKAIIRAGIALGWIMSAEEPGHIVATLNIRTHMAQVDIKYDIKSYNITYKGSTNLTYNSEKASIHSNYNGWVQNLDRGIQAQLNAL